MTRSEDWLLGSGAVRGERWLVAVTAVVGAGLTVPAARTAGATWDWWQWLIVLLVALDVVGGVAANALGSAKLFYGRVPAATDGPAGAAAARRIGRHSPRHDPVVFAALHLHPFALVLLLPGGHVGWAAATYGACVGGTAVVRAAPLHLARPVGLALVAAVLMLAPVLDEPVGLGWFAPVLALKLVVAHAVPEEPYRPGGAARST